MRAIVSTAFNVYLLTHRLEMTYYIELGTYRELDINLRECFIFHTVFLSSSAKKIIPLESTTFTDET